MMNEERWVNLVAVVVFGLTLAALVGPWWHLSPAWVASTTLVLLGLATADAWLWQSQGLTFLLGLWPSERVLHHEAGHFLVAHLMGIPIEDYTLDSWSSWRRGYPPTEAGVQFGTVPLSLWPRCPVVWMAGVAAEEWLYGDARGGVLDQEQALRHLEGFPPAERPWRLRLAQREAQVLLQNHAAAYWALVEAMRQRKSVAECVATIEQHLQSAGGLET
ncbi:MAG: hypothetical protein NZ821_07615 [Gloeomargarita sp. SKYB31]|nr:hypothetical protein [Gloeomargarita sp. SKYB31]